MMKRKSLNKKSSIIGSLRDPMITVFEDYVHYWISSTAEELAISRIKKYKLNPQNFDKLFPNVKSDIKHSAGLKAELLSEKIPGVRYMVVAEGELDFEQKVCRIVYISSFVDDVLRILEEEAIDLVHYLVKESELSAENFEDSSSEETDEDESVEDDRVYLERLLHKYIPSIFEEDIIDFVNGASYFAVREAKENSTSEDEIPYIIKDKISEDIQECVDEIGNLSSEYINIIQGEYTTYGKRVCKIIPVEDFIDKLYKATFDEALIRAGKNLDIKPAQFYTKEFGTWKKDESLEEEEEEW
jgi:hypothetical protein